ncbi:hypothetical protein UFOVP708_26 [uncultured Caudovirales phage]|uniref:Uncharacterized protein n=1 Tax=uncultured Caudovirales phage TaxID=2100421 RepID=A0A6J5NHQ8_9CAUD|nr:hypothetical protein UFOVP708_26 [uncultured Caudovirales phage]
MRNIKRSNQFRFAYFNAADALPAIEPTTKPPRTLVLKHVPPNAAIDALLAFSDAGLGIPVVYPRTRKA